MYPRKSYSQREKTDCMTGLVPDRGTSEPVPVSATYHFSPQLDKELFPLERDLDNLCPAEGVHLDAVLEHNQTDRSYTQMYLAVGGVLWVKRRIRGG